MESNEKVVGNDPQQKTDKDTTEVKTENVVTTAETNPEVQFFVSRPHNRDYPMLF